MATSNTSTAPAPVRAPNALGQKPRTEGEERAAWVRRIRRWHRKASACLPASEVAAILKMAAGLSASDTASDK